MDKYVKDSDIYDIVMSQFCASSDETEAALNAIIEGMRALLPANVIEELSKPKWIPVTEQLPESGQRVLAVGLHGEAMYIGTYTGGIKETAY